jgi:hypothetical protein
MSALAVQSMAHVTLEPEKNRQPDPGKKFFAGSFLRMKTCPDPTPPFPVFIFPTEKWEKCRRRWGGWVGAIPDPALKVSGRS